MAMHLPTFPDEEYAERLARLRQRMDEQGLDACVLSVPESICYLTGLNHWGFFALHMLIVPKNGNMALIARSMEKVTIEHQLASRVEFFGYKDSELPSEIGIQILRNLGLEKSRIGIDLGTIYRSYGATKLLMDSTPDAEWIDSQDLVDSLMYVKSSLEIAAMRQAANITERMMEAALSATTAGVNEKAIAAEVFKEIVLAGGEPPSFGPFLRPKSRLGEEHGTWGSEFLEPDDRLFVELAGCYQRYHAPMGRFIYLQPPTKIKKVKAVCLEAFNAVVQAMKPGVTAHEVYRAWQDVVDKAGLSNYKRHHCGYMVGMSFPPTWMEGVNRVLGLREGSDMVLEAGMTFHVLSWLVGSDIGDYFVSDTVLVTEKGSEVLTTISQNPLAA